MTVEEQLDPAYFFLKLPLYSEVMVDLKKNRHVWYVRHNSNTVRFDGYEIISKKETTFLWDGAATLSSIGSCSYTRHEIVCSRTGAQYIFIVRFDGGTGSLMKVGQYPTVADLHLYELKEYAGVLQKERREEIAKAIGLAAHGVGIGSFVYLRRVFEFLINETFEQHAAGLDRAMYVRGRMEDRIEMLRDHLPPFLVENRMIYGILSAGVHELTEQQCLAHFDALRTGIEIILDQKVEAKRKEARLTEAANRLNRAKAEVAQSVVKKDEGAISASSPTPQ